MEHSYKRAMDSVQMSEKCRARIREGLEGRAPEAGPSGSRKCLRMAAVMAAVLLLLTGTVLAVWSFDLAQYFHTQTPKTDGLAQYFHPIQASQTSEDGWTVTVENCIGDEDWVFLWLNLTAPEGTELPTLQEGESFYLKWLAEPAQRDYGVKDMIFDHVPGDEQISFAIGIGPNFSPRGKEISLMVGPLDVRGGRREEREVLWDGGVLLENILLDYPDTTTRLTPRTEIPRFGQTVVLAELEVTPFQIKAMFECGAPMAVGNLDGLFDDSVKLEVCLKDGTAFVPNGVLSSEEDGFSGVWNYGEGPAERWDDTFLADPDQIDALMFNGVTVPFVFQPG